MSFIIKNIIFYLIRLYKLCISPLLGVNCRFLPSCSDYLHESIIQYGIIKGIFLGFKRVLRCNPWGGCGMIQLKLIEKMCKFNIRSN